MNMKTIFNHLDNTYKMSQWNVVHMYVYCIRISKQKPEHFL